MNSFFLITYNFAYHFTALILLSASFHRAEGLAISDQERSSIKLGAEDYKAAISIRQKELSTVQPKDKGRLLVELAVLFLQDQDQEKAFQTFLEALSKTDLENDTIDTPEDNVLYQNALTIYFDHSEGSPKDKAKKIIESFQPLLERHQKAHLLAYLVALAHANLGSYREFFELFYNSYRFHPNHFLAYKTKAILHIKLFERARTETEREFQRKTVLENLEQASEKEPQDDMLYKLMISFSLKEKKQEQVRRCLNKILDANIIIPRGDILFFVQEAVDAGEQKLAKRLLEKARKWYQQSKIINSAQAYLDAHTQIEQ